MRIDPALGVDTAVRIDRSTPKSEQDSFEVKGAQASRDTEITPETRGEKEAQWSIKELETAIEQANRALQSFNRRFDFSVHEATNIVMVRVIDSETEELIREVPPEQILNLIAGLRELAGVVVDEHR